ncbi:MAG: RNA polymerase sigma-70 factor [Mucilaginibacter sp.]
MREFTCFSDDELLDMLKNEDEHAFNELYNRYWEKLFNAAYKRLKHIEAAEEVVQDLFTDLWLRRKTLNIRQELPVYLFSAIKYLVIKQINKTASQNTFVDSHAAIFNDSDNSTEEWLIANDLQSHLQSRVELLPVKCREIYHLSRDEHQSNKDIAQQLNISEKTVENQITKALKRLRASLNIFFF